MKTPRSRALLAIPVLALMLAGCAQEPAPDAAAAPLHDDPFAHVHGIGVLPGDPDILVASHAGVYRVDSAGEAEGPLGGEDFDAMGFTVAGGTLFASGHPGAATSPELGAPNLGIVRSVDGAATWEPVARTGVEDFHVLTGGPDGSLFGIGSSSPSVQASSDAGTTWTAGAVLAAADLAVGAGDELYAATEDGLQVSVDGAATFAPVPDAPLLFQIAAGADGTLVGAGIDGQLWRAQDGRWTGGERFSGALQALAVGEGGSLLLVDDRGLVRIDANGADVIRPAG
ncbi:hypothetical protein FQ330_03820 [Agrococcus sediminis]|uniref:Exo-alpha-sialidase n=1 Tax=Agrococcus sediminis TaxID=2599924 RepID=A0A5M8QJR9_9MICO|nr:hypothetical protein [Agrococcus sediminis]KAA6434903.1 hypothetical protein FQ330_03820 [Agrococcus sediminis]RWR25622.1 hypothetical protein D8Y24_01360 [Agrococcus lahaulensis]